MKTWSNIQLLPIDYSKYIKSHEFSLLNILIMHYLGMDHKSWRRLQWWKYSFWGCTARPDPDHAFMLETWQWPNSHVQQASRWHFLTFTISRVLPAWNFISTVFNQYNFQSTLSSNNVSFPQVRGSEEHASLSNIEWGSLTNQTQVLFKIQKLHAHWNLKASCFSLVQFSFKVVFILSIRFIATNRSIYHDRGIEFDRY